MTEETLFSLMDRVTHLMAFIWDVFDARGHRGTDERVDSQKRRSEAQQRPGVHNEAIEMNAISPDLSAVDFKTIIDKAEQFICGIFGVPWSWFGAGGKAYQEEAALQGEPTFSGASADAAQHQERVRVHGPVRAGPGSAP